MSFLQCFFSQDEKQAHFQKIHAKNNSIIVEKFKSFLNCCLCLILNHLSQVIQNLWNLQDLHRITNDNAMVDLRLLQHLR